MVVYGRSTVSEFLGDRIVYRNLQPADPRLPGLAELGPAAGLPPGTIPRKSEPGYARVIVGLLRRARALEAPGGEIRRLVFVGDTRLNDGTAFANLCQAGGWPGLAFICAETDAPAAFELTLTPGGQEIYLANRWSGLTSFDAYCTAQGLPVDAQTAVVVDLDKTAIGARGRNAATIDQARVDAVRDTVADLLGPAFAPDAFRAAYDRLNRPEFHPFTADNQDYVAYICLMLGSRLYDLEELVTRVQRGELLSFETFIAGVDARSGELPAGLAAIHASIYANVQAGDPTPFKAFRRNEYRSTVGRMGHLADDTPVERLLAEEIVITQEVRSQALEWLSRGALLFGLSDKPDEASTPGPELAAEGYRPIHRTETHVVGAG